MRYIYKPLDEYCSSLPDYDNHAVYGLVLKDGRVASATFIHRRGKGAQTLGGAKAESGGGIRFAPKDGNDRAAFSDGLRLSTMMSQKSVGLFGDSPLALGGGKTVIFTHNVPHLIGSDTARKEFWQVLGQEILTRIGTYLTAEDMGTTTSDLAHLARYAPGGLVTGHSQETNPSPVTARGVIIGMEEAVREYAGKNIDPYSLSFAIQGVGNVGGKILETLWEKGARQITISDTTQSAIDRAQQDKGGIVVTNSNKIHKTQAEIFMPCATGGILNEHTILGMKFFSMVVGCANNQLATPEDGVLLHKCGIIYIPDYIVNAGGMAKVVSDAITGGDVNELLERIRSTLQRIFAESGKLDKPISVVTDEMIARYVAKLRPAT